MLRWVVLLSALVGSLASAGRSPLQRYEAVEPHMGTLVKIIVYTAAQDAAAEGFRSAFDRIADLDRILSDYKPDSELNQLTAKAVGRPLPISKDLLTVLAASQELAAATDGAFDVTLGPVVRLWRTARASGQMPDPGALNQAAGRTGFRKLHVDLANQTATLDQPDMALDVGAIGKGYAASAALGVLRDQGIRSALVAVSGDLAFSEAPPGQRGWHIDIHNDDPALADVPRVLDLTNAAVSTSGPSEQHLDVDGRRYSHVIDPTSKMGLVNDITVTVIARNGLDADGLDTAVSVVGPQRGLALIESRPGTAALIIQRSPAGTSATMSSRFRAYVEMERRGAFLANPTPWLPSGR